MADFKAQWLSLLLNRGGHKTPEIHSTANKKFDAEQPLITEVCNMRFPRRELAGAALGLGDATTLRTGGKPSR